MSKNNYYMEIKKSITLQMNLVVVNVLSMKRDEEIILLERGVSVLMLVIAWL